MTYLQLFLSFLQIGALSFGGGYVTDQFKRGLMDPSDTSDEDE